MEINYALGWDQSFYNSTIALILEPHSKLTVAQVCREHNWCAAVPNALVYFAEKGGHLNTCALQNFLTWESVLDLLNAIELSAITTAEQEFCSALSDLPFDKFEDWKCDDWFAGRVTKKTIINLPSEQAAREYGDTRRDPYVLFDIDPADWCVNLWRKNQARLQGRKLYTSEVNK